MAHIIRDETHALDRERENILAALKALRAERFSLDRREYALMQGARALDATWKLIGEASGMDSPQAAQQRYERLEKRIGP